MTLSDQQILRVMECVDLRVKQLEGKKNTVDEQIRDEVHDLRDVLNIFSLERELRRLKQCR